ncbi:MAG: hypothetical protein GXY03_06350, partial [Solirubrobacterales bacterium]|nr:hypothetical protein [Solirubrobacterales bacterium]
SRASTSQSELKTAAVDRAQREVEAIRALPYEQVAHPLDATVAGDGEPDDPALRLSAAGFAWDRGDPTAVEPLARDAAGVVALRQDIPRTDSDRFAMTVWRFVTAASDPGCAGLDGCPSGEGQYRRVTVVVRPRGLGNSLAPVWTSTIVIDPLAAANNDETPATLCQTGDGGGLELCSEEALGVPETFFLTNTDATQHSARQPVPAAPESRPLHRTVAIPAGCAAGGGGACPRPDLMTPEGLAPLEPEDPGPPQLSFATDVTPAVEAGRPLLRDSACHLAPSPADDREGALWVSAPLAEPFAFTGTGQLRLYSRSLDDAPHDVELCAALLDVPGSAGDPVGQPPSEIGRVSGSFSWPVEPAPVTVQFAFAEAHELAAGRRIGLRLWLADGSDADVVLLYDHPATESSLTLQREEEG